MAQITQSELEQIYQEELGRAPDTSGLSTYLDTSKGYSAEDVRGFVQGSDEKKIRMYRDEAFKRGEDFYASGMGLTDEFSLTEGGQVVWLKEGQKLDSDYYEDVTQQLSSLGRPGWRAYVDKGSKGGGGILGTVDKWTGLDLQDTIGKLIPNEAKAVTELYSGGVANRLVGGEQWQREAAGVWEKNLGLQEGEFSRYNDIAAKAIVSVAATVFAPATGGLSLLAIPAFTAMQGTSKRIGGNRWEQDASSWSDVAANTAWDAAASAVGMAGVRGVTTGVQTAVALGSVGAAQAKTRGGGEWDDAAWGFGASVAASRSPYVGAAVSAAGEKARGGTWEGAAITGGTQAVSSYYSGGATSASEAATRVIAGRIAGGLLYDAVVRPEYEGTPAQQDAQRNYRTAQRVSGALTAGASASSRWRQNRGGDNMTVSEANRAWWDSLTGKKAMGKL